MLVENLRVLDNNPGARFSFDGKRDVAGGVLTEIVNRPAFTVLPCADWRQWRELAHRRRFLRHSTDTSKANDAAAFRGGKTLQTSIVDLAEIDAGFQDRQEPALPSRVSCGDDACGRVGGFSDLGDGGNRFAPSVDEWRIGPHQPRAVPSVGEPDVDLVAARPSGIRRHHMSDRRAACRSRSSRGSAGLRPPACR